MSSWGRLSSTEYNLVPLNRLGLAQQIGQSGLGLCYGMGRSYGDACLNPGGVLWNTARLDRFIHFDESTGLLTCESGVLLGDIQRIALQRGWMLAVTPGTQFVTVGGAIANDVHGKNHHSYGSFGNHVKSLTLMRTSGEVIQCGPEQESNWFRATVGGLGLTGVITQATLQLKKAAGPWLDVETIPFNDLAEFFELADSSELGWEYTVSWIDCGKKQRQRGIFFRANPSAKQGGDFNVREKKIPITPPISLVNRLTVPLLNALYFRLNKRRSGHSTVHYKPFFYPLDGVLHWNRMYGANGFFQHQCVVPRSAGPQAIEAILNTVARSAQGSFLTVLKTFGERSPVGMMSFARPGVTLAIDFANRGEKTQQLLSQLDSIACEAGGAVYLAKDARMSRDIFERGYPNYNEFLAFRDPSVSSGLAQRLMGV